MYTVAESNKVGGELQASDAPVAKSYALDCAYKQFNEAAPYKTRFDVICKSLPFPNTTASGGFGRMNRLEKRIQFLFICKHGLGLGHMRVS